MALDFCYCKGLYTRIRYTGKETCKTLDYRYVKLDSSSDTMYTPVEQVEIDADGYIIIQHDGIALRALDVYDPDTKKWCPFPTLETRINIFYKVKKPMFQDYYLVTFQYEKGRQANSIHGYHIFYRQGSQENHFSTIISDNQKYIFKKDPGKNTLLFDEYCTQNFQLQQIN